MKRPSLSLTY